MTYAGNAADALLKCATKMSEDKSVRDELVLISDSTPIRNFYDLAIKPLYEVRLPCSCDELIKGL